VVLPEGYLPTTDEPENEYLEEEEEEEAEINQQV